MSINQIRTEGKKSIPRENFTTIYCGEKMWNNNEILKTQQRCSLHGGWRTTDQVVEFYSRL